VKLRYLLDTNTLSEPLKPQARSRVIDSLTASEHEIATAAPVVYEMIQGAYRLPELAKKRAEVLRYLEEFVATIPILPYDAAAARWHGQEQARLVNLGRTPAFIDGQIAAIAKVNELVLVTRNLKDFENFTGLSLENWFI